MKKIDKTQEGWADNITGLYGKYSHYYKDGISLCGKWEQTFFMTNFNKDDLHYSHSYYCSICERRRKKLNVK